MDRALFVLDLVRRLSRHAWKSALTPEIVRCLGILIRGQTNSSVRALAAASARFFRKGSDDRSNYCSP